jgi:gag-polypeptide of LTR copia-type
MNPLSDEELEKNEDEQDSYDQKQAAVWEIMYQTIDTSSFLQVRNEKTAADVWRKLILIHAEKGGMYETDLLTKLQNMRLAEGDSMHTHLTAMMEIKEHLAEIGSPLSDTSFVSYIHTSLSLSQTLWPLLITLSAASHKAGKLLTSNELIWQLNEEANSVAIKDSINKSNAAMLAHTLKAKREKGKERSKRDDILCTNTNCKRKGHSAGQKEEERRGKHWNGGWRSIRGNQQVIMLWRRLLMAKKIMLCSPLNFLMNLLPSLLPLISNWKPMQHLYPMALSLPAITSHLIVLDFW